EWLRRAIPRLRDGPDSRRAAGSSGLTSLTGFRWSLSHLVDYARDPRACDLAAVREAIRRYEYEEALARTFARILVRLPITTELMAEVLPYSCSETVFTICLIALTEGDRGRALVETAERNRF